MLTVGLETRFRKETARSLGETQISDHNLIR